MQLAGHAADQRVKFLIAFYVLHQRTIAISDFVPVDAVKFGIVITIAHVSPNIFQNCGAVFRRKFFFCGASEAVVYWEKCRAKKNRANRSESGSGMKSAGCNSFHKLI